MNECKDKIKENQQMYGLGIALITFKTKQQADTVEKFWGFDFNFSLSKLLELFKSNKYYTSTRGEQKTQHQIRVSRAPMPDDIIWSNLSVGNINAFTRRGLTFFCTAILLGISFGAQVALKVIQFNINKSQDASDNSSLRTRAISILITLIIMIINQLLSRLIRSLTFVEKHWTKTFFYQSLTIKIVAVRLILTSVSVH